MNNLKIEKNNPQAILEEAEKSKKKKRLDEKKLRVDLMLSYDKKPYQSLGIGVHNNTFYYGTVLEDGNKKYNAVVTDDGRVYVCWDKKFNDEIKDDFCLNYRFDLFDDCIDYMWSNDSIKDFRDGVAPVKTKKELFDEIKKNNKEGVWHTDEEAHEYTACDIISNYVYPVFNSKGRTYHPADFGSGKSRQALMYQLMSFNPLFAGNITPASFERVIESTGGTIIVDNFDNMHEDLKKAVLQVIEVYYKKGSKTIKAEGQGAQRNRPVAFNGYSPLVINNIVGLPEVTESRCNVVRMLKTNNKKIVDKKINPNNPKYRILRDHLHIWALKNWKRVREEYENLEVPELSARDLERCEAVLTIAKLIGDGVYQRILSWILKNNEQQSIKEISDNWEFLLYDFLNEVIKEGEKRLEVREITKVVSEKHFDSDDFKKFKQDKLKFSHYVGKVLRNQPLVKKSIINGWVNYTISRSDLDKMLQIKGFDKYLTIPHLTSLNPTNNTNNTNITNNTNLTPYNNKQKENEGEVGEVGSQKSAQGGISS